MGSFAVGSGEGGNGVDYSDSPLWSCLRVGDNVRVPYDVTETRVGILAVVPKSHVSQWLERYGATDEEAGSV